MLDVLTSSWASSASSHSAFYSFLSDGPDMVAIAYLLIHSLTHLLTYSLTHLLTYSLNRCMYGM